MDQKTYTFRFIIPQSGNYTLHIDNAYDRCTGTYVLNTTLSTTEINVTQYTYYSPTSYTPICIPPPSTTNNYTSWTDNTTNITYTYTYTLNQTLATAINTTLNNGNNCSLLFIASNTIFGTSTCNIDTNTNILTMVIQGDF